MSDNDELLRQSFRNIANFYRAELLEIQGTGHCKTFTKHKYQSLQRCGVLKIRHAGWGREYAFTPEFLKECAGILGIEQ